VNCEACENVVESPRTDFYPPGSDFRCGLSGEWLGFHAHHRPETCPLPKVQRTLFSVGAESE